MKALILSGGTGTRLRPLTHTGAKQLVPIANKPIIFYVIENIVNTGIKDVGIIISPETGNIIKKTIGNGKRWGIKITYIIQSQPKGLAHAVKTAQSFLKQSSFLMYLGDNLLGDSVNEFVKEFRHKKADALILLKKVKNPSSFGVAQINKQKRVVALEEKPKKPKSDLALVGVYLFSSKIHQIIKKLKPSKRGELEITDAIQKLIDQRKKVSSHIIRGWWLDTGKKDDLLQANTIVLDELIQREIRGQVDKNSSLEGRIIIAKTAKITNSVIRGPVVIGKKTVIKNSFIGPFTSVGNKIKINKSNIEHCVILDECQISEIRNLKDSLIGKRSKIIKNNLHPQRALRLTVGDDSTVEV